MCCCYLIPLELLEFRDFPETVDGFCDVLLAQTFLKFLRNLPRSFQVGFLYFLLEVRAGLHLRDLLEVHILLDLRRGFLHRELLIA